ncbi:DUF937 domain-containing protein [Stappia sp.]|uniref:DUF937 domain-containing protein n=1 Tax=Stappia sp. TaxID=1870903 RepID=UPI0032D92F7C
MSDGFPSPAAFDPAAFDPAAVVERMQRQFGWSEGDILRAAEALMPAAFAGLRRFATSPSSLETLMALMPGPGRIRSLPDPDGLVGEPLALFFGTAETQRALADFVARQTGLERPGVETLMPVVATLALGQVARQFTGGPARDLLDAFLAGYARGRPKPAPNPMRMMAPYTEAMRSFWDGYLGLFEQPGRPEAAPATGTKAPDTDSPGQQASVTPNDDAPNAEAPADDAPADEAPNDAPTDRDAALLDRWIALGRDIQDTQIRGFETFFEKVSSEGRTRS